MGEDLRRKNAQCFVLREQRAPTERLYERRRRHESFYVAGRFVHAVKPVPAGALFGALPPPVTLPKIPFFPHFPLWKREKLPFFRIFLQNWRKIFDKHVPPVI